MLWICISILAVFELSVTVHHMHNISNRIVSAWLWWKRDEKMVHVNASLRVCVISRCMGLLKSVKY